MKVVLLRTYLLFGLIILNSCVEKQDFDQFDEISLQPELEASVLYVTAPEALINLAPAANFYAQDFNFDAFNEDYFAERVIEGSITYLVENTTSKELEVSVQFLDDTDTVLDTEIFTVPAAPTPILEREIAYGNGGRSIEIIRNTSSIRVIASNLGDSTSISDLPEPMITLRSSGRFRLLVR